MKKVLVLSAAIALTFSVLGSSVLAVDQAKTATVNIQSGDFNLTVANNIDFGSTILDGSAKVLPNIEASNLISIEDNLGDGLGWEVNLTISDLNDGVTPLSSANYDFDPAGADLLGTGVSAGSTLAGVAPDSPVLIFNGSASSVLMSSIDLKAGFLKLNFDQNELPGTYSGNATFSLTTTP
jgi:hypothetical protein